MVKNNSITLYLPQEDENKITDASKKVSLSKAAFCRTLAVKEAMKILKENPTEAIN
jgi:hypothetical protein